MSEAERPVLDRALDRMAHQLKNPLQAIVVNLEVVRLRARQQAPEAWEALEPFATSIDANVKLLDRRLRLLLHLCRSGRGPERVDVGELVEELVAAVRLDEPPVPVRVEMAAGLPAGRVRAGPLVGLLFLALERLRDEREENGGEVRVRVHAESGKLFVDLGPAGSLGAGGKASGPGEEWETLVRAACESGVELRRVGGGEGPRLRIALPGA